MSPAASVTRSPEVIIVGAGMAGLSAAKTLTEAGVSTRILEARDRIGGRAVTDHDLFDQPVDLGASWLHGADRNPLVPIAREMGFTLLEDADGGILVDGRRASAEEVAAADRTEEEFLEAMKAAAAAGDDPAAGALLRWDAPFARVAANSFGPMQAAKEIDQSSAVDVSGFYSGGDLTVKEGLGRMVVEYGRDLPVEVDTAVQSVSWDDVGVTVETAQGDRLGADRLLITVPPSLLGESGIRFDPPLPDWKREAIDRLPMGLMNKVILRFSRDVFPDVPDNAWVKSDEIAFFLKPGGANLAIGFIGADRARELEEAGAERAVGEVLSRLRSGWGDAIDHHLLRAHVTEYGKDPWSRGAYPTALPGSAHLNEALARPVEDRLFFAGDGTASRERAGSLGGAYESGLRAAEEILRARGAVDLELWQQAA